jgi:DNA-binding GntR family transcriptional regulator
MLSNTTRQRTTEPAARLSASQTRFTALCEEIRMRICTMDYPPGFRLSEEALALEFNVSRSPIRRVLARLEFDGLVEIRHGVGSVVTMIDPDQLSDVYALRMAMAELIGTLDPLPGTPEVIEKMRGFQKAFKNLKERRDYREFACTNIDYYMTLTNQVGNRYLRDILRNLFFLTSRMWLLVLPSMDWAETLDDIAAEIEDLIRTLELDDRKGLGFVARNHIFRSMTHLTAARSAVEDMACPN